MNALLAAIKVAPDPDTTPAPVPSAAPAATPELIRDIAPPVDYFPYPMWLVVLGALFLALLLGLLCWWIYKATHRPQPPPIPRPARTVALEELQKLEAAVHTMAPYEFSIAVSEVLRRFIEGQYYIPALEQTTPEFLSDIADRSTFDPMERSLLAGFLERCDSVKFGRVEADATINEGLIDSALAFVKGGKL
jgi:hypothetical protein